MGMELLSPIDEYIQLSYYSLIAIFYAHSGMPWTGLFNNNIFLPILFSYQNLELHLSKDVLQNFWKLVKKKKKSQELVWASESIPKFLNILHSSKVVDLCRVPAPKSHPAHRYRVVIFTFSGLLRL